MIFGRVVEIKDARAVRGKQCALLRRAREQFRGPSVLAFSRPARHWFASPAHSPTDASFKRLWGCRRTCRHLNLGVRYLVLLRRVGVDVLGVWGATEQLWNAFHNCSVAPQHPRSGKRRWCPELHRLRAVFLAAMGADEANIQASLCAAIRIAKEQKSVSLETPKQPTRSTVGKRRAGQEDTDSDYLFGDCSQRAVSRFGCGKSSVIKQTLEA